MTSEQEKYLSHLYTSNQTVAYAIVKGMIDEIDALNKKLEEEKALNPQPQLITLKDFELMMSMASQEYVKRAFPIKLSGKEVPSGREPHFFLIEAFVAFLNKTEVLKKQVVFDYRR